MAADLAARAGWSAERQEALAEAIRLYTAVTIALEAGVEAHLLCHATGLDVTGHRHSEVAPDVVDEVVAAYPRLDFKRGFMDLIADQAARKPGCWAARVVQAKIPERVAVAPFPS